MKQSSLPKLKTDSKSSQNVFKSSKPEGFVRSLKNISKLKLISAT